MGDAVWNHAVFSKNRDRLLPNTDSERIIRSFEQKDLLQPEIGVRIRAALRNVGYFKAVVDEPTFSLSVRVEGKVIANITVKAEPGAR